MGGLRPSAADDSIGVCRLFRRMLASRSHAEGALAYLRPLTRVSGAATERRGPRIVRVRRADLCGLMLRRHAPSCLQKARGRLHWGR